MTTDALICGCGLIKQTKVGTSTRDGVVVCNSCGLPIELTPDVIAASVRTTPVAPQFVTTLADLPGYTTLRSLGVVSELSATSGLTATVKGTNALDNGMLRLRQSAGSMNANAIVGLTSSSFGAAGGITSAFGGDAVGVLLIGTAAVVKRTEGLAES